MTGTSIATNVPSSVAQLNLDRNQALLGTDVTRLSSGLRINAAADDPSGLAISQSLQSHVGAYDASSGNVQTANNALVVADGAMQSCEDLLQRMRSLAVEASSDITSIGDRDDIQAEITQLLQEVNTIAVDTTFNGRQIFQQVQPVTQQPITEIAGATNEDTGGTTLTLDTPAGQSAGSIDFAVVADTSVDGNVITSVPAGWTLITTETTPDTRLDIFEHTVAAGDPAAVTWTQSNSDYLSGQIINFANVAANPIEQIDGYANDGFELGSVTAAVPGATETGTTAFAAFSENGNTAAGTAGAGFTELGTTYGTPVPYHPVETQVENDLVDGAQPTATYSSNTNDSEGILLLLSPIAPQPGLLPLNVHDGAAEGDIVGVTIPGISTAQLGISSIDVTTTSANSDISGAQAAEAAIDIALQLLNSARAEVGSQVVALNDDASADQTDALNEQASESDIADANIGKTTTDYTRLNILIDIGTSVLAQANADPGIVLNLFRG